MFFKGFSTWKFLGMRKHRIKPDTRTKLCIKRERSTNCFYDMQMRKKPWKLKWYWILSYGWWNFQYSGNWFWIYIYIYIQFKWSLEIFAILDRSCASHVSATGYSWIRLSQKWIKKSSFCCAILSNANQTRIFPFL
jgi:hypothetical protein